MYMYVYVGVLVCVHQNPAFHKQTIPFLVELGYSIMLLSLHFFKREKSTARVDYLLAGLQGEAALLLQWLASCNSALGFLRMPG